MKIEKITKIEIAKGNRYEDDGYLAKTLDTDNYQSCFGHVGVNGAGETIVTQTGDITGIMYSDGFDAAAIRVMETGTTEIFELVRVVEKPMTSEERAAYDRHEKAVDDMMTLGGTTY